MSKLTDVICTYTGGGIYVCTAKYEDVYFVTDLENYGTYDVPWADIEEKYNCDYESHWKDSSFPLPTWGEVLNAIRESYNRGDSTNMDMRQVEQQICINHDQLFRRLDESDYEPRACDNSERLEMLSLFIEQFEEFLEERCIDIPNHEKEQDPNASTIYGTDYSELSDRIENVLSRLGMI